MTRAELVACLPLAVTMATAVLVMVQIPFGRRHAMSLLLTLAGLLLAIASLGPALAVGPQQVAGILMIDGYALFFMGLILASSFAVAMLAFEYLDARAAQPEEFYVLLLCAALGSLTLVASDHFAAFFLGMELLSVSLFTMIGYRRRVEISLEAAIKYLVIAGVSSATLLFGMALVYADRGSMHFSQLAAMGPGRSADRLMLTGLAMIVVGFGFKLALVPFHLWTPDVYQGAPAPVSAFIATVSKGAMFALLLRLFTRLPLAQHASLVVLFYAIAIASMFTGNLLALRQTRLKRLLAYSSIAHLGYLLVAFLAAPPMATVAVTFYLVAYFVTMLTAFGVVTVLSAADRDADRFEDFQGLAYRRPWLAVVLLMAMLSLAGVPLTAGFFGKFYIVAAGVDSALTALVLVLVVSSAIGLYYYLRVVAVLYTRVADQQPPVAGRGEADEGQAPRVAGSAPDGAAPAPGPAMRPSRLRPPGVAYLAVAVLAALLLLLGMYPTPAIRTIETVSMMAP